MSRALKFGYRNPCTIYNGLNMYKIECSHKNITRNRFVESADNHSHHKWHKFTFHYYRKPMGGGDESQYSLCPTLCLTDLVVQ